MSRSETSSAVCGEAVPLEQTAGREEGRREFWGGDFDEIITILKVKVFLSHEGLKVEHLILMNRRLHFGSTGLKC